jgi:hypothetical protein
MRSIKMLDELNNGDTNWSVSTRLSLFILLAIFACAIWNAELHKAPLYPSMPEDVTHPGHAAGPSGTMISKENTALIQGTAKGATHIASFQDVDMQEIRKRLLEDESKYTLSPEQLQQPKELDERTKGNSALARKYGPPGQ